MTFLSNKLPWIIALTLIYLATWLSGKGDSDVRQDIDDILSRLPALIKSDPTGATAQRHLLQNDLANRVILPYFYATDSPLEAPSSERQRRVKLVEGLLQEHESSLISVLDASERQSSVPDQLKYLLPFAASTELLKGALLRVARKEVSVGSWREDAYDVLFKLGLDDAEVRNEVIKIIDRRNDPHGMANLANELLGDAGLQWGLPDLLPLYSDFLSVPYRAEKYPKNGGKVKLLSQYNLAIRSLAPFGIKAANTADLIKARMAEMDPVEDVDLLDAAKETLLMLEGKAQPKPLLNLKGELLGISKSTFPTGSLIKNPVAIRPKASSLPSVQPSAPSQPATSATFWISVVVLSAALAVLLWSLPKRRA